MQEQEPMAEMNEETPVEGALEATDKEPTPELDPDKLTAFHAGMVKKQNFIMGLFGGVLAAFVGAVIWAGITLVTEYQIGWMAVGVGVLVGLAVRKMGRGISIRFGVAGAVCALVGCLLGNLFTACGFIAGQEDVSVVLVLLGVLLQPAAVVELLVAMFSPIDLLFYGIALYEGYKLSFRQPTQEELAGLVKVEPVVLATEALVDAEEGDVEDADEKVEAPLV